MDSLDEIINAIYNNDADLLKNLKSAHVSESSIKKILAITNQQDIDSLKNKELLERHKSGVETFIVIKELKKTLINTLKESKSSQFIIKLMYVSTFLLGLILIGIAVYFGVKGQEILSIAFGSFGMLSIITFLIKDPPIKIQDSRSNYTQLTTGVLAWFSDLVDKSGMEGINNEFHKYILSDKNLTANDRLIIHQQTIDNYLKLSNTQINNTIKLLKIIDEVAEPGNIKNKKNKKGSEGLKNGEKNTQEINNENLQ
ncbi:hypothetical protein [Polaribacter sp.]|uniref:hypothetical protein n=1 Tax=Polaribacter sp. TaxID=1920175 RepID=UPI003EFB305B